MNKAFSKFHKLTSCDGLEALATRNYNISFPFHFHQTYNISLVYEGAFRTKVGEKSLCALPGSILITNPLEIHSNPFESDEFASFFTFYVSPDFFRRAASGQNAFFQDNVIYDAMLFDKLHQIALQIENDSNGEKLEYELSATLNELSFKYAFTDTDQGNLINNNSLFEEYLVNEDFEKFSLEHSAKQFGIDKFKFLRLFKSQTGLTPNNYVILKRIEKSKEMLFAGHDLLGTAIDLGFYDIPHFSKHFKKFTGIAPSIYCSAVEPKKL